MKQDIAEIAGKLTKAQRKAITEASWVEKRGAWWPDGYYTTAQKRVRRNICSARLTHDYLRPTNRLTELGLAVRAHLLAHSYTEKTA